MKRKYIFVFVLLLVLSLAGGAAIKIGGRDFGKRQKEKKELSIVTSFYPMYVAVRNVTDGVEGVKVENLTEPKTGCLHDYQLTSQDMVTLGTADVFVVNGGGMESFLDRAVKQYPKLPVVTASGGIKLLKNDADPVHMDKEGDSHEHEEEFNAHVWMDISKYEKEIDNIVAGLKELDPDNKSQYEENGQAYKEKLDKLKNRAREIVNRADNKNIIIFHDSFAYFAEEYGLELKGVLEMDENTSLSASGVAKLIQEVRKENVGILFAEQQYGTDIAAAVAKETGAKVYLLDSLVTGDGTKDSYLKGMEKNLKTLKEALLQ